MPGYYDALEALKVAATSEQKSLREWLGNYDPEHFDLDAVNRRLQPKNTATTNQPSNGPRPTTCSTKMTRLEEDSDRVGPASSHFSSTRQSGITKQ